MLQVSQLEDEKQAPAIISFSEIQTLHVENQHFNRFPFNQKCFYKQLFQQTSSIIHEPDEQRYQQHQNHVIK